MKINFTIKIALIIIFFLPLQFTFAQNNWIKETGKVGVGTISPIARLEINSLASESILKMKVEHAPLDYLEIINATNSSGIFMPAIKGYTKANAISLYLIGTTDIENDNGNVPITSFDSRTTGGKVNTRQLFAWSSYGTKYMTMAASGNLGLGIENPAEKLAVNGDIRAREIKVEVSNWPDFVFHKGYPLLPLQDLEKFIKTKGHLPDLQSAAETEKQGISLGEMNKLLLKKIEELTLYLIEQDKKISQLELRAEKQ